MRQAQPVQLRYKYNKQHLLDSIWQEEETMDRNHGCSYTVEKQPQDTTSQFCAYTWLLLCHCDSTIMQQLALRFNRIRMCHLSQQHFGQKDLSMPASCYLVTNAAAYKHQ